MRTEASFQQILESKIRDQRPEKPPQQSFEHLYFEQDPAHLAYLLGQIRPSYFRPLHRAYPSKPQPKSPPPPHSLTEEQQWAMNFFSDHGVTLSPAFSQKELKKAFRALALKLHPDMNKGAGSAFIQLKNNYETLRGFFTQML